MSAVCVAIIGKDVSEFGGRIIKESMGDEGLLDYYLIFMIFRFPELAAIHRYL